MVRMRLTLRHFVVGVATLAVSFLSVVPALCQPPAPTPPTGGGYTGGYYGGSVVGGVEIDANGILRIAPKKTMDEVGRTLARLLEPLPTDLNQESSIRKISLKKLDEQLRQHVAQEREFPDTMRYLGGLTSIRYVVVVPEENDILLVGPAEGWKVDAQGYVVGTKSGKPVLRLEDLITVFRTWNNQQRPTVITCSIDPTQEALANVARLDTLTPPNRANVEAYATALEQAYGLNVVTIRGVPEKSRIGKILVAADYKMKKIGLGQEPSQVRGLPSYTSLLSGRPKQINPRFWLAPEYTTVSHDSKKLTWELGAVKVKALSEDEYVDTRSGSRQSTGNLDRAAVSWCDKMTANYDALAKVDPVFGELKNCMEIALVVALIHREGLLHVAGCKLPAFADDALLKMPKYQMFDYPTPQFVQSRATISRSGRLVVVSCGGVEINPFGAVEKATLNNAIDKQREKLVSVDNDSWWANGK